MAWTHCRDQIVTIIEATEPTTTKRGIKGSFKHVVAASEDNVPGARSFWFEMTVLAMVDGTAFRLTCKQTFCQTPRSQLLSCGAGGRGSERRSSWADW